jgi:putative FmdB family regulatory protein
MPTYTYQCDNCGVRFDRYQKFTEKPLTKCPECSEESLRKVYTPVGIVFKGSGFYATDHRSPSGASRKNGSSKEEGKTESSAESSSEAGEKTESKQVSEKKTD